MRRRLVLFSFVVVSVATGAGAQTPTASPNQTPAAPVFRSGAELVSLSVAVTDNDKHFVRGLSAGDFVVFEDGVRQDLSFFAAAEVPLDLILLLDTSASMSERMSTVHEAALGFLRTLRGQDRGAVVSFSDGVQVRQPLTGEQAKLEAAVRSTTAHGATALNNAIYVALKEFGRAARQTGDVRRQAIAVLSDGDDTCSLMTFDDVLLEAKKAGVGIYTISLRNKGEAPQRGLFSNSLYSMKTLALETGAQAFFPTSVNDLAPIYASIADELDHQYALGYAPKNARADGRFRRVVVQVASRPDLRLRTRTGYFAERATPTSVVANATTSGSRP